MWKRARDSMITTKTDPFRGDKMKLAISSIGTLVERVDNLYKTYSDKLVATNTVSQENRDKSNDKYSIFDKLNLFNGKLMPFQERGVYWLTNMYLNSLNGILADEMGLGKTIQIIAFIAYILEKTKSETKNILIIVPLSVLPNWVIEFKKFAPKIPVLLFHGNAVQRKELIAKYRSTQHKLLQQTMKPIVVTNYESLKQELRFFQSVNWDHLILDEAHRIKNAEIALTAQLGTITFNHSFLLTGTPFQNDLQELWSLLYFVFPTIFEKHENLKWLVNAYDICEDERIVENEEITAAIKSLHKVLEHFMIRRIKVDVLNDLLVPKKEIDVYCGLSQMQMKLYDEMLNRRLKTAEKENQSEEVEIIQSKRKRKSTVRFGIDDDEEMMPMQPVDNTNKRVKSYGKLLNNSDDDDTVYIPRCYGQSTFLRMKQVIDHPYLIVFPVTPKNEFKMDERLITDSGKMIVLDKMLKKLMNEKHRVLIFSMTVMMLDLIEELMVYRNFSYRRFDGSTDTGIRQECIEEYNKNKKIFAFLLSTKAGGVGINLTGADTVIFYDRSWNPQQDIQAQDRCHRIGQNKPVMVFTLVAKNTVDERVINVATAKRRLEKMVIQNENSSRCQMVNSTETFVHLQKMFMDNIQQIDINQNDLSDEMIDKILDRSELYEEIKKKKQKKLAL